MAIVELKDIQKSYENVDVLKNINLSIKSGELIVIVGPSGCGKSTLLRSIAGLEEVTQGEITIDGNSIIDQSPARRGIAMVFQSYALYPHMSVFANIAFSLKLDKVPVEEIQKRVHQVADTLQLKEHLNKLPKHLSGGQRQRVAIGRAIIRSPKVFLFDEPLSNLDAALRTQTRIEISKLHKQLKATMIYVTHDQTEAMTLSDRMVVLNQGKIEQVGTPMELYKRPKTLFVATFIGNPQMNIIALENTVDKNNYCLSNGQKLKIQSNSVISKIGIRPEHFNICNEKEKMFTGTVDIIEQFGDYSLVYITTDFNQTLIIKITSKQQLKRQDQIYINVEQQHIHRFDKNNYRENTA